MAERLQVGVLFGGPSPEFDVSCASALSVVKELPRDRFQPVVIGVTRTGQAVLVPDERVEAMMGGYRLEITGTDVMLVGGRGSRVRVLSADAPYDQLATLDVVFPVMHGPSGEDGVFQGFLEWLNVPYVGCGVLASAVSMDKVAMKRAFRAEGIPMTPYVWFTGQEWQSCDDQARLVAGLEYPLYVKPANMGSSIGVSRVAGEDQLATAVKEALRYDQLVVVEQGVTARELVCGVLGEHDPQASVPGEIGVPGDWLDYQQKYVATEDTVTVPAVLPADISAQIRDLSLRAFRAVGGWGLARVDFLYDEAAGRLYVLEINTMPGFTARSTYSRMWKESGIPYADVLTTLIDSAFTRHLISAPDAPMEVL